MNPVRDDSATVPCPVCGLAFGPSGRRQYCSTRCRQAAFRHKRGSAAKARGRQGRHRLPVPRMRGALPGRAILQRLWDILPPARPGRPVPVLRRSHLSYRTAQPRPVLGLAGIQSGQNGHCSQVRLCPGPSPKFNKNWDILGVIGECSERGRPIELPRVERDKGLQCSIIGNGFYSLNQECQKQHDRQLSAVVLMAKSDPAAASGSMGFDGAISQVTPLSSAVRQ